MSAADTVRRARRSFFPGLFTLALVGFFAAGLQAQDLSLGPADLRIEQSLEGGYVLRVRAKPGCRSVMLVESTEDPDRRTASYALRDPVHRPTNGDELRVLDGKFLEPDGRGYFIVDSTPEPDPELGEAFRLFIPYLVTYGNPWNRNGEVMVLDGTYLNVRTFEKPYCDYTGPFLDHPFTVKVTQSPIPGQPEGNFMPEAVEAFRTISEKGNGGALHSSGEADIAEQLDRVLDSVRGKTLELVLAIDTTESMANDLAALKAMLPRLVSTHAARCESLKLGFVYYRDYFEEYLTRIVPFRAGADAVERELLRIRVNGGRDIPEAVFEALYAGVTGFEWQADERLVVLIGDAPPHPKPRGSVTETMVYREADARGVKLHTIILPQ